MQDVRIEKNGIELCKGGKTMSNRFTAKLRRMLSMLLVLAMVLSMVGPVTASATAYTAGYSDSMQLQVGERIQLKAPLWYFKTTWSSSDETVATVSQMGILTGVKAGEAVITAKSGKLLGFIGLERTTTYHVTVTEVPEKVELHVGDTTQLTVEDNGGKVLWSSSNPRVAKVSSNGTVTAMREGEATVTAKIMERSAWNWLRWYQTLEVKFQIIVTPVPTEPEVPTEPTEPEVPTEPTEPTEPEPTDPVELPKPENPTASDDYYWDNSKVYEVKDASQSEDVLTETEVIVSFAERGFSDYPINYEFSIGGEYVGKSEVEDGSEEKHPVYFTYYVTEEGELWVVYSINGMVLANPASFNIESDLGVEAIFSEQEMISSYDCDSNKYYVNIPYSSTMLVMVVDRIDAETLDSLTIEAIGNMT